MTSEGFELVGGLKNDCQLETVSDVWRVWDTKVSRVDDDVWGRIREPVMKGRRVGSANSFMAQGIDENWALISLSGSSSKRSSVFEAVMIVA